MASQAEVRRVQSAALGRLAKSVLDGMERALWGPEGPPWEPPHTIDPSRPSSDPLHRVCKRHGRPYERMGMNYSACPTCMADAYRRRKGGE